MAVTGVSNLAEPISSQSLGKDQSKPSESQLIQVQNSGSALPTTDTFTPSHNVPATVASTPQTTTNAATLDVSSIQGQLQSLNTALLGLGLSNGNILAIDRIASTINDFNPIEYSDLVRQFQAQAAQQTAGAATGNQAITLAKTENK